MEKKDLVMGAVGGYTFDRLRSFIVSLQQTGFDGDIVLLYTNLSAETLDQLRAHNVLVVPLEYRGPASLNSWSRFWPQLRPIVRMLGGTALARQIMKHVTPLQTSRFYNYHDFVRKHRHIYRNVLITDVRDVIFQANPFQHFDRSGVQCYEEDLTMEEEGTHNLRWIKDLFGERASADFLSQRIVCSGTILGPTAAMLDYFRAFESTLLRAKSIAIGGSDQGIHNYIIRKNLVTDYNLVPNGTREVLTFFPDNARYYKTDERGFFVKGDGEMIPLIHQYDRDGKVRQTLLDLLVNTNGSESLRNNTA